VRTQYRWVPAPSGKGQDEGCLAEFPLNPVLILDEEGANNTHYLAVGSVIENALRLLYQTQLPRSKKQLSGINGGGAYFLREHGNHLLRSPTPAYK
jgi:hypothetical protein